MFGLGRWRRATGDVEHDDLAEVIAVDLEAVTARRAGDNRVLLPPLPRRAGHNGDVAIALLAAKGHAICAIQLMSTHDDLSGICRRHQDERVHAGEPLGLTREKHRTGPIAVPWQFVSGLRREILLSRNRTDATRLEIR